MFVPIRSCHGSGLLHLGQLKQMTWAFFHAYCDEAYVVPSLGWISSGKCPAGFDRAAL